jgi:dienelactone hydrolase
VIKLSCVCADHESGGAPLAGAASVGPLGTIVGSDYTYYIDGQQYQGYMSYSSDLKPGSAPAALIVHQWMGLGGMEKLRADEMASHGYIAFAVDMYGAGKRATTSAQAVQYMHEVTDHPTLLQQRARKGIDLLKSVPGTNASAIVANGYCFGGLVVLELARQTAPVAAVASFHGELGNLTTPNPLMGGIPVQVHHGDLDSQGTSGLNAFEDQIRPLYSNGGTWETHKYGK